MNCREYNGLCPGMYVPLSTMWGMEMSESPSRYRRTVDGLSTGAELELMPTPIRAVILTLGSQGSTVEPSIGVQRGISCVRYS